MASGSPDLPPTLQVDALPDQEPLVMPSRREMLQAAAATLGLAGAVSAATPAAAVCETPPPAPAPFPTTVAGYVLSRLYQHGVDTLFTVPAATSDALLHAAVNTRMRTVVTSSDLEAGYAADGYARLKGLSAVTVSYGPGLLSMINAIAGAYVERSPMVIIHGGPSAGSLANQRDLGVLFSHSTGSADLDRSLMRDITAFHERAGTAAAVPMVVDRAITAALTSKRPVFIEIASDLWRQPRAAPGNNRLDPPAPAINAAVSTLARRIRDRLIGARRPVIVLGEEIQRRGLGAPTIAVLNAIGAPWTTTLLGKGVIAESTPGFAGVHDGRRSPAAVNALLADADVILGLGAVLSLDQLELVADGRIQRLVLANDGQVRFGRSAPVAAPLASLIVAMTREDWPDRPAWRQNLPQGPRPRPAPADPERGLGHDELFLEVRAHLTRQATRTVSTVVVADTALSTHPAADLPLGSADRFVCGAAWKSIGHSLGVALGLSYAGDARPLVLCGDGGFQTIAQALSTLARERRRTIIVVIDNGHYAIEQLIVNRQYFTEGCNSPAYLDLNRWNYAALARAMGVTEAREVTTPTELRQAFIAAEGHAGPALIAARVRSRDLPRELRTS